MKLDTFCSDDRCNKDRGERTDGQRSLIPDRIRSNGSKMLYVVLLLAAVIALSVVKWPNYEVNYRNSDATWHTLLTIEAYDGTPLSEHKFLPLVSLGDARDKWISWGATIPDNNGNYYYTSFSPMGYVLPYSFMKVFHFENTEFSLYVFNTLLLMISCLVITKLFQEIYGDKLSLPILAAIMAVYILSPEIMHGMGLVYWHQSLMQIFLPLQCLFYYRYIKNEDAPSCIGFLITCLINPYTEWSGYVANAGYFLAEIVRCYKRPLKKYFLLISVAFATAMSFALFCLHYLSTVECKVFFDALKDRFFVRNISTDTPWKWLIKGYWESFAALILLTGIFSVIAVFFVLKERPGVDLRDKLLLFVTSFPLLENIVMKQHAVAYTYDRMKLALPLMLVLYWCIQTCVRKKRLAIYAASMFLVMVSLFFARSYKTDSAYVWETDYRRGNERLCEFINGFYDDSVCGSDKAVRGYVNMTLGRGCYGGIDDISRLEKLADAQDCRYIIMLYSVDVGGKDAWNLYKLEAEIYDRTSGNVISIKNNGSDIMILETAANDPAS